MNKFTRVAGSESLRQLFLIAYHVQRAFENNIAVIDTSCVGWIL